MDFTELSNIISNANSIEKPAGFINGSPLCKATLLPSSYSCISKAENNSLIKEVEDEKHNTIKYYTYGTNKYSCIDIDIKDKTDRILYLAANEEFSQYRSVDSLSTNPFTFNAAYDVANNILYYYYTGSKNNYVTITPTSLADTIKVYGYYYKGAEKINQNNYLNNKLIQYEDIK